MAQVSIVDSPAKRARLPAAKNPYWQGIAGSRKGVSLGYRKPQRGSGTWTAKLVLDGHRREARLAQADDAGSADGALPYPAAVTAAMEWARGELRKIEGVDDAPAQPSAPITVATALDAYVDAYAARKKTPRNYMAGLLKKHVLSDAAFAETPLAKLTSEKIIAWRKRLAPNLSGRSVNWILTVTRAALNQAADQHRRVLPPNLPTEIKAGTKSVPSEANARKQILADADIRRLVAGAFHVDETGDFGRMILCLAATGARFSQVARIRVADVQVERMRIMVPPARKGRPGKTSVPIAVPVGADIIAGLQPALASRLGHEPLLMRWTKKQVGPREWIKTERGPWTESPTARHDWARARAYAGLPADVVMYAFRHSSIVRGLCARLPVRLVAALHDTSVGMIEAHYSAYIVDATEDLVRPTLVPLAPAEPTRLCPIAEVAA
ncbi:hypothetical protein AFCDBAGC_5166 [Methylobacterium cerastii]|uniref:Tyr recombinase domain-containing protein n=1 Tax=Methylobacterium cerastii TaxID=932741 RepID=A0ABQ4QPQ5_9HYPH|nr:tyrosine-type recombinase/integrase [Methylobacterium cerastii]GJD47273.1 hypothetical protein AFCDBAGC_5166 [Methylobacterium cerastii]